MDLQAQDRVHRIGQNRPVMIYRLVTANTVEGRILEKANQKRKLEKLVIHKGTFKNGASAAPATKMKGTTLAELAEMLSQDDGEKYQVASKDDVVISDKHLDFLLNRTEAAYNGTLKLEDVEGKEDVTTFEAAVETRDEQNDALTTKA